MTGLLWRSIWAKVTSKAKFKAKTILIHTELLEKRASSEEVDSK